MTDVNLRGRRTRRRPGRTMELSGAAVLILVAVVCLGTLPYTFGHSPHETAGVAPRRFAATNLAAALLPPFWAPARRRRA